jgi:hypothetical protein
MASYDVASNIYQALPVDPKLKAAQLRDIGTLLALRYGASLMLGAVVMMTLAQSMGGAATAVVGRCRLTQVHPGLTGLVFSS